MGASLLAVAKYVYYISIHACKISLIFCKRKALAIFHIWKSTWLSNAIQYWQLNIKRSNKAHFALKHLENKILTEPQPKKTKLLCCIRKSKLFYLVLDGDSNNIWEARFQFPLRHPENKILTEPQPKKAKLLCCIRKAKLFFLMLDRDSNNI